MRPKSAGGRGDAVQAVPMMWKPRALKCYGGGGEGCVKRE